MFNIVTALWHHSPSTQRQLLADLSTKQWWLDHPTTQRQLSSYSSDEVCYVLYLGPLG